MYKGKKVGAIVPARMASSRLPGKVLLTLHKKPVLQHIVERLQRCEILDHIIIATTTNRNCDPIVQFCRDRGYDFHRGEEDDVLSRFVDAAHIYDLGTCLQVTGDCPVADWRHAEILLKLFFQNPDCDYCSNVIERTFPSGCDMEVIPTKVLEEVAEKATGVDRIHVTTYIYKRYPEKFKMINWVAPSEVHYPQIRVTLDTLEDYTLLYTLFSAFGNNHFSTKDLVNYILANQQLLEINADIKQKGWKEG